MPRSKPKYVPKNKRKQWDEADMVKAIVAVREKKMGTLKAAKTFNVPRGTLRDLSKKNEISPANAVSNDNKGEQWIMCVMCNLWAHNDCAGAEKEIYICDFCK